MKNPLNILVIMTDQQRRETVGANPGAWIETPHIDGLAADGVNFQRAYTPCPICVPARFTLLTGLHANRAVARPGPLAGTFFHPLDNGGNVPDPATTLPSRLRQAGYHTAVIGKTHMFPYYSPLGFEHTQLMEMEPIDDYSRYLKEQGFDIADQRIDLGSRGLQAHTSPVPLEHYPTSWVTRETLRFLRGRTPADRPFFLWCSFLRPHNPYNPPPPYHGSIDPDSLPRPVGAAKPEQLLPYYRDRYAELGYDRMQPDDIQASRARYCESVRLIDDCVGDIVATLQATGQWEHTAIIFTSDHGDALGDHSLWHKTTAFECSAGVPLLMRIPGCPGAGQSQRLASLVDLAPTCLDLAGLPIPPDYDGRSLTAVYRETGAPWRESVLLECGYYPATWTAVCTDRWKYVHHMNGGFEELYDLQADPRESLNLAADATWIAVRDAMRRELIERIRREGAPWYLLNGDLRVQPYDPAYNYYTGQRQTEPAPPYTR